MQVIGTQLKKQLSNKKSISLSQVKLRNKKYKRGQDNTQVAVIGVILEPARPRNINFWPKQGQLSNAQGQTVKQLENKHSIGQNQVNLTINIEGTRQNRKPLLLGLNWSRELASYVSLELARGKKHQFRGKKTDTISNAQVKLSNG